MAVVDVLVDQSASGGAASRCQRDRVGRRGRRQSLLREELLGVCAADGVRGFLPSRAMCTDNAAMIAATGWYRLASDGPSPLDTGAMPNLRLPLMNA